MSMRLYEIAAQYIADVDRLQDLDMPPEAVNDTIDAMQGDVTEKLKAVLIVAMGIEAEAAVRAEHAKRMADSAKAMANRAESLRSYAQNTIQSIGIATPIKYPEFNVSLTKNPPSCEVLDEALLPPHLKSVEAVISIAPSVQSAKCDPSNIARVLTEAGIGVHGVTVNTKADKREVLAALKELKGDDKLPGARVNPTSYRLTVK